LIEKGKAIRIYIYFKSIDINIENMDNDDLFLGILTFHFHSILINHAHEFLRNFFMKVSSNDYSSDFDSSISSNNDYKRYSPNTFYNPYYNSNNNSNDSNTPYVFGYNNQTYFQGYADPSAYYYNNLNQFRAPFQQCFNPYPYNQMKKSLSTQKIENSSVSSKHFPDNLAYSAKTTNLPQIIISETIPNQNKSKQNPENVRKKSNLNSKNIQDFKYPTTTNINPEIKIHLQVKINFDYPPWFLEKCHLNSYKFKCKNLISRLVKIKPNVSFRYYR